MGNLSGESREQNRKDKVTRFRSVTYARQLGLLVNTLGSQQLSGILKEKNTCYVQKSAVDIATKNDLLREIQSVWRNIELAYIRNLYQSIPDRLDNVLKTVLKLARVKCKQTPPY